ncbi:MAG TPA: hypothetical protein VLS93_04170, partial [Anaeromyxobacteraceae bacterium]|nr:hypothetical protein [Anaeromyxobacteraceae bacterium]
MALGPRQIPWTAVAAAVIALACGDSAQPAPRPRSVSPAQGPEGAAVAIRIEGDGLAPHVITDYGDGSGSRVDPRFRAWLGPSRLREVTPSGDGALLATVPEDLPPGAYDLAIEDPDGRRGTLPAAYRVVAATDAVALVAAFTFAPVGPQEARAPFSVTVTAVDSAGQVVTGFSGTVAIADRTGALVPASIGPFAWGVWTGPVEVRAPIGADALTATDALGHTGRSNDFAVAPAAAARLVFGTPPVDTVAGACTGPVTVSLEDLYGMPTVAPAGMDVAVSEGTGAVGVYVDPGCAVAAAGATIPAGAGSADVWVRSTVAAPFTLEATAVGLDPGSQAGLVRPAAPERLVFTTPPQTVAAGACSAPAGVVSEDAFGNVSPVGADTPVSLASDPAGGLVFHAGAGCGAPVAEVTMAAGTATASFSFLDTRAEVVQVAATGLGISGAASQIETIVPASRDHLVLVSGGGQTVSAGSCSGAVVLESRDAFENVSGVGPATAVDLSGPGDFQYFTDAGCTVSAGTSLPLAAGTTQVAFWFKATVVVPSATVTASVAGWAPVAIDATITQAVRDHLVLVLGGGQAVSAGSCSGAVVLESRDAFENVSGVGPATAV